MERKNENRGYQRLRVWQDAATLYVEKVYLATRREADQLSEDDVEILDHQAFKLENGLLRLIESLERKRDSGTWTETLIISESNTIY